MIKLDMSAKLACVEPGCSAQQPVALCLTRKGGLVFHAAAAGCDGWEVGSIGPHEVLIARCPKHVSLIQKAPPGLVVPS